MLTVAEVSAPVFLVAAFGYVWVRLGVDFPVEFVTRLAMTLALPCLIFVSLMRTEVAPAALTAMALASLLTHVGIAAVAFAVVRLAGLDLRTYLAPMIFGNTGNLGLPLALFAFGEEGLGYGVVFFAISIVVHFTAGLWVISGGGSAFKVAREPAVAGALLGALFLWRGWRTPTFLTNALELAGQMAIPLMLITLGVAVARLRPGRFGRAAWLSAVKAALCAGIAALAGHALSLPPVAFAVLVVQSATPIAVTSYLLAEKYGADADAVAGLVVVSTLLSVAVLPTLLAIVM